MLSGLTPMEGITPDILTAGIGYLLADRLDGWWGDFGMGVLIASIGQITRGPIENFTKGLKKPEGGNGGGTNNTTDKESALARVARQNAMAGSDLDSYTMSKYGV